MGHCFVTLKSKIHREKLGENPHHELVKIIWVWVFVGYGSFIFVGYGSFICVVHKQYKGFPAITFLISDFPRLLSS